MGPVVALALVAIAAAAWLSSSSAPSSAPSSSSPLIRIFTRSTAAGELGDPNQPTGDNRRRAELVAAYVGPVVELVREVWPAAHLTSGYRSAAVNRAAGGVADSRHLFGLAFDLGGHLEVGDLQRAARYLRSNVGLLPARPRFVEVNRDEGILHFEWFDPLGRIDGPPSSWPATRWAIGVSA